jgi:flagellar biosynthesis/type III secretory pathway chaperone
MKKELNYYDIHIKVMKKEKLTLEEKKIHFEKMVYKNNLIQTLYKKDEERAKKAKERNELVERVEKRYPNREPIRIFNRSKIFK